MKFTITIEGTPAEIDLTLDGKGGFTGTASNPDFGTAKITKGVQTGNNLTGSVSFEGYTANFSATLWGTGAGSTINGTISDGLLSKSFTGVSA